MLAKIIARTVRMMAVILLALASILLNLNLAVADNDTVCRNTPGVKFAYAYHLFDAGDLASALSLGWLPPEQLLPRLDWHFF